MDQVTQQHPGQRGPLEMANVVLRMLDGLVRMERRPIGELFQLRFIAGGAVLGLLVALGSLVMAVFAGNSLVVLGAFSVFLIVILVCCRAGVSSQILVWGALLGLTVFLFLQSVTTVELQPNQLAWLVLIPLGSMVLVGPAVPNQPTSRTPVVIATVLALVVGIGIIAAHRCGLTFGNAHSPPRDSEYLVDFAMLLGSVTGMMWLNDLTRRTAERELTTLRQLLSICAWCKKIRDQERGWLTLERYMSIHHTRALTHGICPSCTEDHFPEEPPRA